MENKNRKELQLLLNTLEKKEKLSVPEIELLLHWKPNDKKNMEILRTWEQSGDIIITKKMKIKAVEGQNRTKGILSIVKNKFGFVDRENDESIFIPKSKLNGALDGDEVIVKIDFESSSSKSLEGEIIKIIKRRSSVVVGKLEKKNNTSFVIPTNSLGSDIYIPKNKLKNAKNNDLVAVEITFWGDEKRNPEGYIKEIIGNAEDSNNMIDALIIREGMSNDFPPEVLSEARNIRTEITEKEISGRVDLRKLKNITIDGADAKDLDDAVYVEKLENNNYRLIVSIADVSHYVLPNSELDKEAQKRGNSVYLVDRVLPMFPKEISNGICSLNEKEDKLCFSCELEIDKDANVISSKTYKSIIHSAHRMTYDDVNKIFSNDEKLKMKYYDIVDMLSEMLELSKILRKEKYERGSINFELNELKVILDEKGKVKEITKRNRGESERIIEDFMIAANEAVSREIENSKVTSVYRTHEKPDPEKIYKLNETLGKFGYFIADTENITPKQFQSIIEDAISKNINMIVHKMVLTSLKQARYTVNNIGHFGLVSKSYTHFTSPIRRYADLSVHRILHELHNKTIFKKVDKYENYLPSVCKHISETERVAMKVEEESVRIKLVDYMKDKIGNEYDATIVGFSNKKIFFETEEFIECSWSVENSEHYLEFDEKEYVMKDLDDKTKIYSLGDKLRIKIINVSMKYLEIDAIPTDN